MTMFADPRQYDPADDISRQADAQRAEVMASQAQAGAFKSAQIDGLAETLAAAAKSGLRAFIAPCHKSTKFLIRGGAPMLCIAGTGIPVVPGSNTQQLTAVERVGDVNLQFTGGIVVIDPKTQEGAGQLQWCLDHPDICRDVVNDPAVEVWASLKEGQLELADRGPSIPKNLDVDAALRGDFSGLSETGSIAARARAMLVAQS